MLFLSFAPFGATISRAQDQPDQGVAEAARQERARKQESQKRAKHVYTEEDLKHPNILTPEDRAQVEAKRNECAQKNNCSPAPSQNPPETLDANTPASGTSLGEVARQLRKQKELQALTPKQTEPFHLPFSTPALASPILPEPSAIRPPSQPVPRPKTSSPKTPSNVLRRDPFSAVPIRPEVRRPDVSRPEIRPDAHAAVRENIRPAVRPKVSNNVQPKVREDVLSIVRPDVRPNFSQDVRPTLRAHHRRTVPAQPNISCGLVEPILLFPPMQPSAPSAPVPDELVAPVSTTRPAQPQPAASSALVATQAASRKTVSVQRGDSLWKLAQQNLGHGNRWPQLLASNPWIADPNQIRAGAQLNLPAVAAAAVSSHGGDAPATIKVRKGDTLWTLAKSNLGRSAAWSCLAAANPSLADPNRIHQDQLLVVPSACRSTRSSSRSRASPQVKNPN
jgi:LysM repeat protein